MMIEDQIRSMLLGKVFFKAGRVCNLARLFFRGEKEVFLHAQCLVRIIHCERLLISSEDVYTPAHNSESSEEETFQWDNGFSVYDHLVKEYFESTPIGIVTNVKINKCGDVIIELDNGSEIQVLVDSTLQDREQWRIFHHGMADEEEHIVRYPYEFKLE